jgi:hypothetical protein
MRKCVSLEDWLHEVFQVNLSDMKHIAIALFVCSAILIGAGSSHAQLLAPQKGVSKTVPSALPSVYTPTAPTSLVFVKGGATPLNALTKVEPLSYFGDTTDNFFQVFPQNDSFYLYNDASHADSTVFYTHGYAMRFTTTLTKAYLDSVQFMVGIDSVPVDGTNHLSVIATHVSEITLNNGSTLPGVDLGTTALASISYPAEQLVQHQYQTITVSFKHKLLAAKDHNFCIFVDKGGAEPTMNSVEFTFDANISDQRAVDSTMDRCLYVALPQDQKHYFDYYMAGRYYTVADPTQHFYPNMLMTAYLSDPTAGVVESSAQPAAYRLAQNYPNPFNPSTEINYALPVLSKVSLKVYNALGMEVATVVNSTQKAGEHSVKFDASELPSGTYFYTLKAGSFTETRRMVLSK